MSDDRETRLKMLGAAAIGTICAIGFGGGFGEKKKHPPPPQYEDRYRAPPPGPPRNYYAETNAAMEQHPYRNRDPSCESCHAPRHRGRGR